MSGVEIRQRTASEGQRGGRRGQEGQTAPLYRASWSTVFYQRIEENNLGIFISCSSVGIYLLCMPRPVSSVVRVCAVYILKSILSNIVWP